ncbi:hypothetical protein BpHYR1_037205 [Brachionus plicatilis]|uniref:Uncharacterized protein n=1 Tax=Brachionus plicatilis TaxID=10195 RepID=A0A3M7SII7_BRAPC|nr:hypothetical protein BpHYR1_037205 [Brachionus plicatilis]
MEETYFSINHDRSLILLNYFEFSDFETIKKQGFKHNGTLTINFIKFKTDVVILMWMKQEGSDWNCCLKA